MAEPARYNTFLYRGDTFDLALSYKSNGEPVPLEGVTASMAIKWKETAKGIGYIPAGGITVTGEISLDDAKIAFRLSKTATADLPKITSADYQVRINYSDGVAKTLLAGTIIIYPNRFEAGA